MPWHGAESGLHLWGTERAAAAYVVGQRRPELLGIWGHRIGGVGVTACTVVAPARVKLLANPVVEALLLEDNLAGCGGQEVLVLG